jgi:hypothetical protein
MPLGCSWSGSGEQEVCGLARKSFLLFGLFRRGCRRLVSPNTCAVLGLRLMQAQQQPTTDAFTPPQPGHGACSTSYPAATATATADVPGRGTRRRPHHVSIRPRRFLPPHSHPAAAAPARQASPPSHPPTASAPLHLATAPPQHHPADAAPASADLPGRIQTTSARGISTLGGLGASGSAAGRTPARRAAPPGAPN